MNARQNQGSSANDVPNRVYSNRLELEFKQFTKNQEKFIDVVSYDNNTLPLREEVSHLSSRGYEPENYDSSDIESYDDGRLENYRNNLKVNTSYDSDLSSNYEINNSPKIK